METKTHEFVWSESLPLDSVGYRRLKGKKLWDLSEKDMWTLIQDHKDGKIKLSKEIFSGLKQLTYSDVPWKITEYRKKQNEDLKDILKERELIKKLWVDKIKWSYPDNIWWVSVVDWKIYVVGEYYEYDTWEDPGVWARLIQPMSYFSFVGSFVPAEDNYEVGAEISREPLDVDKNLDAYITHYEWWYSLVEVNNLLPSPRYGIVKTPSTTEK